MSKITNALIPIDAITPHPRNYRSHPDTQLTYLQASHERFGQYRSVVLWSRPRGKYVTVAGHGIIEAMRQRGVTEIRADVLPQNTPQTEIDAILIADNNIAQHASDDDALLAQLLQEQQNAGFDLAALGSDDETLRQMLASLGDEYAGEQEEGDGAEDELPEEVETRCKPGDIWQLGRHRLLVADSMVAENMARLMDGKKAQMVIADPPYGMAYEPNHSASREKYTYHGSGYRNVKHQHMIIGYDEPFDPMPVLTYFQGIREQFWFGADYYAELLPDRTKGSWLVWDKRAGIEDIQFNTSHFELCWSRARHLREIIRVKWFGIQGLEQQDDRHRLHPTQKPLQVISFILEKYGESSSIVADPYLGSGTTLIACERTGHICYGCELSPAYCDIVIARWERHTGQSATLLSRQEEAVHA